jgi:hypothetical protein
MGALETLSSLKHPNVVRIFSIVTEGVATHTAIKRGWSSRGLRLAFCSWSRFPGGCYESYDLGHERPVKAQRRAKKKTNSEFRDEC